MLPNNYTTSQNKDKKYLKELKKYVLLKMGKFTMSGIKQKITRHSKKQENMNHNEGLYQLIEIDSETDRDVRINKEN